jgi:hypothetical protein
LRFCAPVPGFSHICPWALLLRPLQSSARYDGVPVLSHLGPPIPVSLQFHPWILLRLGPNNFSIIIIQPLGPPVASQIFPVYFMCLFLSKASHLQILQLEFTYFQRKTSGNLLLVDRQSHTHECFLLGRRQKAKAAIVFSLNSRMPSTHPDY